MAVSSIRDRGGVGEGVGFWDRGLVWELAGGWLEGKNLTLTAVPFTQ